MKKKINESISSKNSINVRIEQVLNNRDKASQTRLLDALDILQSAGPIGITINDWAAAISSIHEDQDFSMKELLQDVVKNFKFVVTRIADKRYAWDESDKDMNDDLNDVIKNSMKSNIQLSKIAFESMKSMPTFTPVQLGIDIAQKTGYPQPVTIAFADHIISQFIGDTILQVSPGTYKLNVKVNKNSNDHLNDLKDLIRRAGINKKD